MFDRGSKLDKNSIIQTLNSHKMELKGFGVDRIGLFVSYHTNKAQPNSDIDFLEEIQKKRRLLEILWLWPIFSKHIPEKG